MPHSNTPHEALKRIEQEKKERTDRLDLSRCYLTTIPSELKGMDWLMALSLTGNELTDISPLRGLVNLMVLDLSYNELTDISLMRDLVNLAELDLHFNKLTDISPLRDLVNLTTLDLSGNKFTNISLMRDLVNLTKLYLYFNKLTDISSLRDLVNLTELNLSRNQLTDITPLCDLVNLTELNLSRNQLTDISPLRDLVNLTELDLSDNELTDISPVEDLVNLTELDLTHNELADISPLRGLVNLMVLDLSYNELTDISPLRDLVNLTELDLTHNELTDISPVEDLVNLTELDLYRNQLADITSVRDLVNLTKLNLSYNELTDISPLRDLVNLTKLYLSYNELTDISPLRDLVNLTFMHLSDNELTDISPLRDLLNLTGLDLSDNELTDISPVLPIIMADPEISLDIRDNPLTNPPYEIAMQGNRAILDYFDALEQEGEVPNDHIKLIMLGNSTAGKTSLARYITTGNYNKDEDTTHGIHRLSWNLEREDGTSFFTNIWDFGGQDYYHATHRLFLTNNAVYTIVCNSHKEVYEIKHTDIYIKGKKESIELQHYPYTYWLNNIKYHIRSAGDGNADMPPVVMVQTRCDELQKEDKPLFLKDEERLKYGLDGRFYHISIEHAKCLDEGGELKKEKYANDYKGYKEHLVELLEEHVSKSKIPASFPVIRDVLRDIACIREGVPETLIAMLQQLNVTMPENPAAMLPVLQRKDYEAIARRYSKSKDVKFEILRIYLMDMVGSILHFADNPMLRDKVWIDPDWLHNRIYEVLSRDVLEKQGRFTLDDIAAALNNDREEALEMAAVLQELQLVFEWKDGSGYVAPQYLPYDCPRKEELEEKLSGEYQLMLSLQFPDFLPGHVISRVIVHKGQDALGKSGILWRNGIEYFERIEDEKERTIIIASPVEKRIDIYLHNNIQVNNARIILKDLAELVIDDICDRNGNVALQLPGMEPVSWQGLCDAKKHNNITAKCLSGNEVPVKEYIPLLPAFKHPPVQIFVSYAHDDHDAFREFISELKQFIRTLETNHDLELVVQTDLDMTPGEMWHEYIMDKVNGRDILLCMVSQNFLDSKYIRINELGKTIDDIKKGKNVDVIPVYFRPCHVRDNKAVYDLLHWKPSGSNYEKGHLDDFAYADLIWDKDGKVFSNPNRDRYMKDFVKSIENNIVAKWKAKAGKRTGFDNETTY